MGKHATRRFLPSLPWVLFLVAVIFFGMMPRLLLAPLLVRIAADLGVTFSRASLFFLSESLGFTVGLLVSGYVAQRLRHRWTIVLSLALAGVSLVLLSRVRSVALFHGLIFVAGWANGLYPGSAVATVTTLAADAHRGKALAVHECGPNLAYILAPIIAAFLAPLGGWRVVVLTMGIGGIVTTLVFAAFGKASTARGQPPSYRNLSDLARNPSFWALSALYVVVFTAATGVYAVMPTYLMVNHGLSERFVNNLIGLSRVAAFAAILSAGTLTDRFGIRPVVTTILVVTGVVTVVVGLGRGWLLVGSVFLQPMLISAFYPVGLNAISGVTGAERRNLSVALVIPLATIFGVGVAPPILSAAGSHGWFSEAFVALGVLTAASVALVPLLRRQEPTTADS